MTDLDIKKAAIAELCKQLKIKPLSARFDELSATGKFQGGQIGYADLLLDLLRSLKEARDQNSLRSHLQALGLRHSNAAPDTLDFSSSRTGFEKAKITELFDFNWAESRRNLIIEGETATGKTYLADALCISGVLAGRRIWSSGFADLMKEAELDPGLCETLPAKLRRYYSVAYIDDWGIVPPGDRGRELIGSLAYQLEGRTSLLLTAQTARSGMHAMLGGGAMADAALSRIYDDAVIMVIGGPSMRKRHARAAGAGKGADGRNGRNGRNGSDGRNGSSTISTAAAGSEGDAND